MPSPPQRRRPAPRGIRLETILARRAARQAARRTLTGAESLWERFAQWFNGLGLSENTILLGFAGVIGTVGALGVVAFYELIDLAHLIFFQWPAAWLSREELWAYRPLVTAAGIACAWWIMRRIGEGNDGLNVPDVQRAVARRGGDIPTRPALARTAASAVTLGAGGSAGSEGPVVVLGASLGSLLGRLFHFGTGRVKILVAAGAAAGISAAFNAPLAGAFFALEEILGSLAVSAFPPVVVASVVAAVVSHSFLGNNPAFPVPEEYGYALTREVLVFYPLLGVVSGLMAAFFVRMFFGTEARIRRLPIPGWLTPWLGGAAVGALVLLSGGLLVGDGHFAVRLEVFGRLQWHWLGLLAVGSMLATSVTLSSGGSGGVFTPSLYVGAATGGSFGVLLSVLFPGLGLSPEAYALVGMGAVTAAATGAPITAILLVFEMTNDYGIMLPLMLATVISWVVARQFARDNLYSGWLRKRGEHIEQGTDRDLMDTLRVGEVFDPAPQTIPEGMSVSRLLQRLAHGEAFDLPVIDADGRLVGIVTVAQLGRVAKNYTETTDLLVAADIAIPAASVSPTDSVREAVRRMGVRGVGALPVVDPHSGRLLGVVTRAHVLGAYERAAAGQPA